MTGVSDLSFLSDHDDFPIPISDNDFSIPYSRSGLQTTITYREAPKSLRF